MRCTTEREDVDRLLRIATRSRLHTALVGILLLTADLVFALLGAHAIVIEITVTGILMIVLGARGLMTEGKKGIGSILMIVLGVLFVLLTWIFEALHGLMLFLEFLSQIFILCSFVTSDICSCQFH